MYTFFFEMEESDTNKQWIIEYDEWGMERQVFTDPQMSFGQQISIATETGCAYFITTDGEKHMRNSPMKLYNLDDSKKYPCKWLDEMLPLPSHPYAVKLLGQNVTKK